MPFNGSGLFTPQTGPGYPAVSGTTIAAEQFNRVVEDFAEGLSSTLVRDGQGSPTSDLPMGTRKHTGVGDANSRTDYAKVSQVQDGSYTTLASVAGTDAITANVTPVITAYVTGQLFTFTAAGANTGAVTLNINGLGARAVTKEGAKALASGDIASGAAVCVMYDGTRFQIVGGLAAPVPSPLDPTLVALAELDGSAGVIEQTGPDTFTKRTIGFSVGNVPIVTTASTANESVAGLVVIASQADAIAGTSDTVVMTPFKTAQAIAAQVSSPHVVAEVAAANGYRVWSDGWIEQWGITPSVSPNSSFTASFPIAFPSAVYNVMATAILPAVADGGANIQAISLTSITIGNGDNSSAGPIMWRVLGK